MKPKLKRSSRQDARKMRQGRIRRKIVGTNERPRLSVYRSLKFIYAQVISDDEGGKILASCSSKEFVKAGKQSACNKEAAKQVGLKIAELAKGKNITNVVFDRNGYLYHGKVAELATGAREGGLSF